MASTVECYTIAELGTVSGVRAPVLYARYADIAVESTRIGLVHATVARRSVQCVQLNI